MENQMNTLAGMEVFQLAPADINHLFRRSGLSGNTLSPYRYDAEQAAVSTPSQAFKALAESIKFQQVAARLLEPDVKIEFNSGGGSAAEDKYYAFLAKEDQNVLLQFVKDKGELLLILFPDWITFLEWWASVYAANGMEGYQTVFPSDMETELLVCAIHCLDIYRRSYMESMLDYRGGLGLSLPAQEFVQLLKRSLASKDKRWLLPTLFEITPGLKGTQIALKPEHIEQAAKLGFLTNKEGILTLDERSKLMGTEFITSWIGTVGWQATALINGEERSLSRVFVAVTAFTNHLISFKTEGQGATRFRHQASSASVLVNTLVKWMESIQKAMENKGSGGKKAALPAPPAQEKKEKSSAVKAKFCSQCGTEIRPGKKFCSGCGTVLV